MYPQEVVARQIIPIEAHLGKHVPSTPLKTSDCPDKKNKFSYVSVVAYPLCM